MQRRCSVSEIDDTSLLTSIHDVGENQWNNLVTQSDQGTLFHRTEWLAAVEEGLDYDPHHLLVLKGGNPIAVLPNFVAPLHLPVDPLESGVAALNVATMKSGYPGYGGPVIASDERENIGRLVDALDQTMGRNILYHRISTYDLGQIRYGQYLESRGYEPATGVALFVVDLETGWEAIREQMDKERRKEVRQAHEQDYAVERRPLGSDLERTHEMYRQNTERVGGRTLPLSFFEALADRLADRIRVFTAFVDDRRVGRYVYILDEEGSVLHHWLSAIPDRACYDAKPAELLHAAAIKWGIEEGYTYYSFDRVGAFFDNSVFQFKSKYGGDAIPALRWEKGTTGPLWYAFKRARAWHLDRTLQEDGN